MRDVPKNQSSYPGGLVTNHLISDQKTFSIKVLCFMRYCKLLLVSFGSTFLIRLAMHLGAILWSQFRRVIGRQFFMKFVGLFFFDIRVINPLLWVTDTRGLMGMLS